MILLIFNINTFYLEMIDERNFAKKIIKMHKALQHMEKSKYLDPYLSLQFDELTDHLRG
jgi:hypothetical protein